MEKTVRRLARFLRRNQTMDFASIQEATGGRSRRSVFRYLYSLGYMTSYTHAGRYYTLSDIPQFDDRGLWFYRGIGFSSAGTLKATLIKLIEVSKTGYTQRELQELLHIRTHNALFALVKEKRINRKHVEKLYVYVNGEAKRAEEQVMLRRECLLHTATEIKTAKEVAITTVIEVLLEVIRAGKIIIAPAVAAKQLRARGIHVALIEVEQVFAHYGLQALKKTPL